MNYKPDNYLKAEKSILLRICSIQACAIEITFVVVPLPDTL